MAKWSAREARRGFLDSRPGRALGASEAADLLGVSRHRVNQLALDAILGTVLIALGVRVAVAER
jgi:hypothetical protein